MKKFTQTTLIALLISSSVFSQTKGEPVKNPSGGTIVNQASNSQLILLSPADGTLFNSNEGTKPVLFRWTAIVPKPKEPVTYRLKVWQLMQGQSSVEAMRSNQPIVTKDVADITQAAISNLYTGPCKPPYLCDFIWAVEALNSEDNQPNGVSDSYAFKYVGGIGTVTGTGGATVDIKSMDKELENTKAAKAEADNKGNAGNSGMSGGKSQHGNGQPIHGVDIKLGVNGLDKEGRPTTQFFSLPIEKVVYDDKGNVTAILLKTEKGESAFVKVIVAGSHSLSGGVK